MHSVYPSTDQAPSATKLALRTDNHALELPPVPVNERPSHNDLRERRGATNSILAAERRNVYRHVAEKNCLAPEERNVIFGDKLFRSLRSFGDRLDVPGKVSIESRA